LLLAGSITVLEENPMYSPKFLVAGFAASLLAFGALNVMAADPSAPKTDRTTGQVIDDSVLTGKVKTALIADSRTKAYEIHVTTREGIVHLNGTVDTPAAKMAAAEVAQSIEGVKAVSNELSAKS
jgi:osmotically-inducible protein OsmY